MYEPVFINKYSVEDLKRDDIRNMISSGLKNDLTYFNVSFGLDMKDPVGHFLRHAAEHHRLNDLIVYQMRIAPADEDLEKATDHSIFYENMPALATFGGHILGMNYLIACSVHHSEEGGVYYTFSNIDKETGEVGENLVEQLIHPEQFRN